MHCVSQICHGVAQISTLTPFLDTHSTAATLDKQMMHGSKWIVVFSISY